MALLLGHDIQRLTDGVLVNGLALGATTVFPAFSKKVVITKVVLRLSASVGVSAVPTVKVEKNPAAGDIFPAEVLTAVTAVDDTWTFIAEAKGLSVAAGVPIDVTVTSAGVGTTYSLLADVFGYIIY